MALKVKKKYPVPHATKPHYTLPQRTYKREQRQQSARRFVSILMVLTVLLLGAGALYTWLMGQQRTALANQPAPERSSRPILKPHKIASDAPIGASVQMVTSDVKLNENASITVRTNPEANCIISVKYNNVAATDSGLAPKVADEFGIVSWSWTIAPSAPSGKWPIQVDCKNKKHAAMVQSEVKVTR